jgi:hypothetical protein
MTHRTDSPRWQWSILLLGLFIGWTLPASAVTLTQTVSREHPSCNISGSKLTVGRDGNVYFASGDYVLRLAPDGARKLGGKVTYALSTATANADGLIATANAHFAHSVNVWSPAFQQLGGVSDFLNSDATEYFCPCDVQAGARDFYGLDLNRDRIVRVAPPGKMVTTYSLKPTGESFVRRIVRFRVWEAGQRFYLATERGKIYVVSFDGKLLWSLQVPVGGDPWNGYAGAFEVDAQGHLLIIPHNGDTVVSYDPDGKPLGGVKLQLGERAGRLTGLGVFGNDLFLKRTHPTEFFQVYDRATGAFKRAVLADVEQLTVTYPSEVWTAGQAVPLTIAFHPGGRPLAPRWRVQLRPFNTPAWTEMPLMNGTVTPPVDAGGLYQLRVVAGSDYLVQAHVEIRAPEARGSVAVCTPKNRIYYGWGEMIPLSLVTRGVPPPRVTLRLQQGTTTLAQHTVVPEAGKPAGVTLSEGLVRALRPGVYWVRPEAEGCTGVPQMLVIGPGLVRKSPFSLVQHGDYSPAFTGAVLPWSAPDQVADHLARARKLGVTLFIDRLGHGGAGNMGALQWSNETGAPLLQQLTQRVEKDPLALPAAKLNVEVPLLQTIAGYGAHGIEQQAILLYMDAGLPVGTSHDARKPAQFAADITTVSQTLLPYRAFRGWSWAANWWIGQTGAAAATSATQKTAYETALKRATDTGVWDSLLEEVSNIWINHAVDAERQFDGTLQTVAPGKISAITGPYRQPGILPPVSFAHADEVDLHYQGEQIQPPQVTPHNVDFYKRPGKRAYGHPELWNDDGTGGQVFPTLLQMAMRGADGVGWSGGVPAWGTTASDPRGSGQGQVSIFRTLTQLLKEYGPWLTRLTAADPVAIPVSSRMLRIETWSTLGGWYFTRLYEAYNACLYAHRPASFVFADDLTPGKLKGYQAILVVSQTVEMEPALASALQEAKAAGVPIFADASCRKTLVDGFQPLGLAFTRIEKDPSTWQDDSAYARFPAYFTAHAAVLRAKLTAVPPVATLDTPEVMLTARAAGRGRVLWAVNNTALPLDPGLAWRVCLLMSQRLPVSTPLTITAPGQAVYDLWAQQEITPRAAGPVTVQADMRSSPARLYVLLPAPLGGVRVRAPKTVLPGQAFTWDAQVQDRAGKPLEATLPIRVRFRGADGALIEEYFTAADARTGVSGTLVAPLNHPTGTLALEVAELVTGKEAVVSLPLTATPAAVSAMGGVLTPTAMKPAPATVSASSKASRGTLLAPARRFGAHLCEIALSADGATALLNAMNWDQNLYALDLTSGAVRHRNRVGHHFAYAPQALPGGFAVQGFDLQSAEGYHLYLLDAAGRAERRFALYGLPKRATGWAAGAHLQERINNFAVAPNGQWIASAGNLGLGVWNREGVRRWSQDWWATSRQTRLLLALDDDTLVVMHGMTATAYDARTGVQRWRLILAETGSLLGGEVSADRKTLALRADTEGGRVYLIRDGKLVNTLVTAADAMAVTADGRYLAVTTGRQVRWFATQGGIEWAFTGDDTLRAPRISPDGRRVAVGSDLGSLYVLDATGAVLHEQDLQALPSPAWTPDGDLLVATWMGTVLRLDGKYAPRWRTLVGPTETDLRGKLLTADATPTTRMPWGNAAETPGPLTPNLLKTSNALINAYSDPVAHGEPQKWEHPIELLRDGKPDTPNTPWLGWSTINMIDSGWRGKWTLQVDTFRTLLKVTGITVVEDPRHPESWLRDVRLQFWDVATERWVDGPLLLSNAPTHTHWFDQPVEAAKFRLVSTGGATWPAGNLRLGELVFHGDVLGASHPDVVARNPVAVLFDEKENDLAPEKIIAGANWGRPFKLLYEGAYTGGKCLALTAAGHTGPNFFAPFGHVVPNWDFEIVEAPQPGQYRWLQFAWKALSPQTTGMTLGVAESHYGGFALAAGEPTPGEGATVVKLAETPPTEWQVVRIDLWAQGKKPLRLRSINFGASGGGAAFDCIRLGRTEADLASTRSLSSP